MTSPVSERKRKTSLIIFIKNPEKGKVKTRIAKSAGDEKALEIYKKLLNHTRKIALKINSSRYLFYNDKIKDDEWSKNEFYKKLQAKGDLGDKMYDAFLQVLKESDIAVIIGSDCAQLNPEIVTSAFEVLANHDIVIGPSLDGGYYLLGMHKAHPSLFKNMTWSMPGVYEETLKRIKQSELSVSKLETLSDIDYLEDWEKYGLD